MLILKVLSLLLGYPTRDVLAALPELAAVLDEEPRLPESSRRALQKLIDELAASDLVTAQERYFELFDRGRKLSLHIFEHTHGESRDRGPAMVELMRQYEACGFQLAARELPDYLPLVLEFAAERPPEEALEMLGEAMPVLTMIGARLHERESAYAAIFDAVEAIVGTPEGAEMLRREVAAEGPDESIVKMDEIWEEDPVTFTEGSALESASRGGGAWEQPVRWEIGMSSAASAKR